MLHSRLVQYIDTVAREGSIRAAGAALHVAPSAINRQLLGFEREIGEDLFERLPRGMRPTAAGELLLTHIRSTMQHYREAVSDIQALGSLPSGEVVVAAMTGPATSIVSTAAARFQRRYPAVRISIRTMFSQEILTSIIDSHTDVGIGFSIPSSPQAKVLWQVDASLGAVVSPSHPLAHVRTVSLAQCAHYPLIVADSSMNLREVVMAGFSKAGVGAVPAFSTNSIESMRRVAATSDAVAFLTRYDVADEESDARLVFRDVLGQPFGSNLLSLVGRDRAGRALAVNLFTDEIIRTLESVLYRGEGAARPSPS